LIEKTLGYKVIKHLSQYIWYYRGRKGSMIWCDWELAYTVLTAVPASDNGLQPIASLKTSVAQVKKILKAIQSVMGERLVGGKW